MIDLPRNKLEIYESFDLSNKSERRLAVYALEEFYGVVLSEIGVTHLDFDSDYLEQNIGIQWNKARRRLNLAGVSETPSKYNKNIHLLKDARNDVAHNYQHNPSLDHLTNARDMAEDWAKWLYDKSKTYEQVEQDRSLYESIYRMTQESLQSALTDPDEYRYEDLKESQMSINEKVVSSIFYSNALELIDLDANESLEDQISYEGYKFDLDKVDLFNKNPAVRFKKDGIDVENIEITKPDVTGYANALKYETASEELIQEDISRREEANQPKQNDKFTPCRVVESYDDERNQIHIRTDRHPEFYEHIWQDIRMFDEKTQSYLKSRDQGDKLYVSLSIDEFGEFYIDEVVLP